MLGLEPPALGAHLEHADRGRVVDEDLRVAQRADGLREPTPVAFAQKPAAQPMRVDAGLARQHAEEQLFLRHLEAEEPHRHVRLRADVLRHVQHEARLPHRRPGGDDDQVGGLEPRRQLVEVGEARGDAGDQLLPRVELLDGLEAALGQVAQRDKPITHLVVGDGEDRVLGLVEDDVRVFLGLVRRGQNLVGGEDQAPEGGLLLDDARVVLDVGRPGHTVNESRDVRRAADFFDLTRSGQLVLERDQVDGVAPLGELHHLVEDAAVGVAEEIARIDHFRGEVEGVVVQQDGAEDRPFGLEVVRECPFRCCLRHNEPVNRGGSKRTRPAI